MASNMIIRHGAPTKLDHAPFGTSCKSVHAIGEGFDLYIQYSKDERNPLWEHMGNFSGDVLDSHICDKIKDAFSLIGDPAKNAKR